MAVVSEKDIFRLQVAMNDAALVRRRQPVSDLGPDLDRLAHRKRAPVQGFTKRLAFQHLHHQVRSAVLHTDVMNGQNIGMVQGRDAARFLLEAAHPAGIGSDSLREDFDGDGAVQAAIASAIYLAHSALPNGREDLIRTEFCAH